jgi:NADH-quinone oxidoreductase subunit J
MEILQHMANLWHLMLGAPAFYVAAFVAVVSTVLVISSTNPVHALLFLVLSLLAVAVIFFTVGAPFAGVLEVIVYAGAIMVLFVFVVLMLNIGEATVAQERRWFSWRAWLAAAVLAGVLFGELVGVVGSTGAHMAGLREIGAKHVGIVLYGPYLLGVELASMLLLAALVAAYHLGKHD